MSLHIGLNAVSGAAYGGWDGPLAACEFDANDMAAIAKSKGMKPTVLLTKKATRANVLAAMRGAAKALEGGRPVLPQLLRPRRPGPRRHRRRGRQAGRDLVPLRRPADRRRALLRAEPVRRRRAHPRALRQLPQRHGDARGAAAADDDPQPAAEADAARRWRCAPIASTRRSTTSCSWTSPRRPASRVVDPDTALAQVAASGRLSAIVDEVQPGGVLISGCQDNQTSMDGEHNGAFTEQLLKVWNQGGFQGNYGNFHARIKARLPATPVAEPVHARRGGRFLAQKPFSV